MKHFTILYKRFTVIIAPLVIALLLVSPAQAQWRHFGNDSTLKRHFWHRAVDSIKANHINDSIFTHCHFDSITAHRIHQWNDTIFFHIHDSAFANYYHFRFDSIRHNHFDSLRRRWFDTICINHNWNDTLKKGSWDTVILHRWKDTIIIHRHRGFILAQHHLHLLDDVMQVNGTTNVQETNGTTNTSITNSLPVKVIVYPNPFAVSATISITNANQPITLKVFDCTGRMVSNMENVTNSAIPFSRNDLPAGIYFYQALNNNSMVASGKLVIQ